MDKNTEIIKSKVKSSVVQLIIAICGAFVAVFGLWMFNQHLLMSFSLPIRMILMIITQWLLFLVPGILMIVNKESLGDIGFRKEKILLQIGIGVLLAFAMSLVLTVFPIMLGLKEMVGNTTYTQTWKFVYQFIYAIFGVALAILKNKVKLTAVIIEIIINPEFITAVWCDLPFQGCPITNPHPHHRFMKPIFIIVMDPYIVSHNISRPFHKVCRSLPSFSPGSIFM